MKAIDNSNMINHNGVMPAGFTPTATYTYSGGNVVVTNASTIPSGDTLKICHVRLHDKFGGEVRGHISGLAGGAGYTSAPTVVFSGGGGSGAAGTAVITDGRVSSVTITAPGSSYETAPTIAFTGGGGSGAAGTVVLSSDAVASVTMTADDDAVTLSASTLNTSKGLDITMSIHTTNRIAADGGAYNIGAAGSIANWDTQQNA